MYTQSSFKNINLLNNFLCLLCKRNTMQDMNWTVCTCGFHFSAASSICNLMNRLQATTIYKLAFVWTLFLDSITLSLFFFRFFFIFSYSILFLKCPTHCVWFCFIRIKHASNTLHNRRKSSSAIHTWLQIVQRWWIKVWNKKKYCAWTWFCLLGLHTHTHIQTRRFLSKQTWPNIIHSLRYGMWRLKSGCTLVWHASSWVQPDACLCGL